MPGWLDLFVTRTALDPALARILGLSDADATVLTVRTTSANNFRKAEMSSAALTSFNKILDASNIDQRVVVRSRHTAALTAPFRHSLVMERSVALPLIQREHLCQIQKSPRYRLAWRCGLVVPNAISHGGPA